MSEITNLKHLIYILDIRGMAYHSKSFESIEDMLKSEYERNEDDPSETNVFFTVFKCSREDRNFPEVSSYLYFDLDTINTSQKENYILALGGFLDFDPESIGVVFTGRGLQCYIKLDCEITARDFDLKYKHSYKTVVRKFHSYCQNLGINFVVDTSVYEPKKVLRYPNTVNYKKDKDPEFARSYVLSKGDFTKTISFKKVLEIGEYDESKINKFEKSFKN